MYTKKEREYYNVRRKNVCDRIGINENQYNWLRRKGEELHRLYVADCNGEACPVQEAIEQDLYKKIDKYIKPLNLLIYYQTDPRGATIYLDKEPIPDNNYTQAHCIY